MPLSNIKESTVSVIIPLYNKGRHIERALSSVLAQSFIPLEIIVIDDGSTDNGPEIINRMKEPIIKLIRQENNGPGYARNVGLAMAQGKYVAFLDADDEWYPSFLGTCVSYLENNSNDVKFILTGYQSRSKINMNEKITKLQGIYEITNKDDANMVREIVRFAHLVFCVIRTDIAMKLGGYYDKNKCMYGEDEYFLLKLLFNHKVHILPESLGMYHKEASELCNFKNNGLQIEPFMKDPDDLISSCPPSKRHLLKTYLSLRAIRIAKNYALLGQGMQAKIVLNRFGLYECPSMKEALVARFITNFAPLMPPARWIWRQVRSLIPINKHYV